MKKYLFMAVAIIAALSSCSSDNDAIISDTGNTAPSTTGTAKAKIHGYYVDVNWVQLWENGPKFAEYNVGATSVTEYGGHYSWGGHSDMKSDDYYENNHDLRHGWDTANKCWGSAWRQPTQAEFQALLDNCDVVWTDNYKESGVGGRIFTGKGDYASNSVFLPVAGYYENGTPRQGGYYWSSTYSEEGTYYSCAFCMFFRSSFQGTSVFYRHFCCSVRAVLAE